MVKIIADRLQRDAEKKLHHLLLFITRGQKVLNALFLRIATFADKFSHQGHQRIELGIRNRRVVLNRCYDLSRRVEEAFGYLRVRSRAVIAMVLDARSQQNDLPFSCCERALIEHGAKAR